jgi:predicted RNA-binding protein with PUA-like domain
MKHWIIKTEPSTYAWSDLVREKRTAWTGVRNFAAAKNLRAMAAGDMALVYHSGGEKAAVGVAKIVRAAYQDPTTKESWVAVDIAPVVALGAPVTLVAMKADETLAGMAIVRQGRLSVGEVSAAQWKKLVALGKR